MGERKAVWKYIKIFLNQVKGNHFLIISMMYHLYKTAAQS